LIILSCTEKESDIKHFNAPIEKYPFDNFQVLEFHQMQQICSSAVRHNSCHISDLPQKRWIEADPDNVVVIQSHPGENRAAMVTSCVMMYLGKIFEDPAIRTCEEALNLYTLRRSLTNQTEVKRSIGDFIATSMRLYWRFYRNSVADDL
jgi:hypothetical protein